MNNSIVTQSNHGRLKDKISTPDKTKKEPTLWSGYNLTTNNLARGWLLLAPNGNICEKRERKLFQKIAASKTNVVYLTDSNKSPAKKHYVESVHNLPEYILNDTILHNFCGCKPGSSVRDIISAYKEKSSDIFIGKVDLPCIYQFAAPESEYFHFQPAFPCLKSDFSKIDIAHFTNYDFYWETNTWNAFTKEYDFLASLILPNYEVSSKIKFSTVLNDLMSLPPDQNKFFPGGSLYREAEERFYQFP